MGKSNNPRWMGTCEGEKIQPIWKNSGFFSLLLKKEVLRMIEILGNQSKDTGFSGKRELDWTDFTTKDK